MKVSRILIIILLTSAISSCRSVKYVPVETASIDTVYLNRTLRDSVRLVDSVYIKERGDTVWMERVRHLYRDRTLRDTVYVSRTDSVRVPYPVERELTPWQRVKMEAGGCAMAAVLALALFAAGRWLWKGRG